MAYVYLAIAFTMNAVANILLKLGAERGLTFTGGLLSVMAANWQFLLGLGLFASNILFYFLALRSLPLSIAYPVMVAMGFLIVNGYALFAFHESIAVGQYIGYACILIGLVLVIART